MFVILFTFQTLHFNLMKFLIPDIDECKKTPGICKGICHNDIGSYHCMECPDKTEYDVTAMQCVSRKKQNLLIGMFSIVFHFSNYMKTKH